MLGMFSGDFELLGGFWVARDVFHSFRSFESQVIFSQFWVPSHILGYFGVFNSSGSFRPFSVRNYLAFCHILAKFSILGHQPQILSLSNSCSFALTPVVYNSCSFVILSTYIHYQLSAFRAESLAICHLEVDLQFWSFHSLPLVMGVSLFEIFHN